MLPPPADHPVHQHHPVVRPRCRRKADVEVGGNEAAAVGVGEEQVVVVVEQPDRCLDPGIGPRGVRQVDQLLPVLVLEGGQAGTESIHHLAQAGEPGPRLDVHHRRRPECGEIAEHESIRIVTLSKWPSQPRLHRGVPGEPAPQPQPPRRHLHQRVARPHRHGQGEAVPVGPSKLQPPAQLVEGERFLIDHRPPGVGHPVDIDPGQLPAEAPLEHPVVHDLHPGTESEGVVGGEEVDGAPHRRQADHPAGFEMSGQPLRVEPGQPPPQPGVPGGGGLRLQPGEVADRVVRVHRRPFQQGLAGQRGAVEGAWRQDLGHG